MTPSKLPLLVLFTLFIQIVCLGQQIENTVKNKQENEQTIRAYTKEIQLNPKNGDAFYGRGYAWLLQQESDKAIDDFTEVIRLDPTRGDAFFGRGFAWFTKREYDKSISDYSEVIRLDPKNGHAFCNRGIAYADKQEADNAIRDFTEAIRLDPKDVQAFYNRGHVWYLREEYDKSISDCTETIRLDPRNVHAYCARGMGMFKKQEVDKAIPDFMEAIRLDPKDPFGFNCLAWVYAVSSDAQYRNGIKAVEYATKGCELTGWKDADLLATLAAAHAESGDFTKAIEWQTKADEIAEKEKTPDFKSHLELYKSGKPYREVPMSK